MIKEYIEILEFVRKMKKHLGQMDKADIAKLGIAMNILETGQVSDKWTTYELFKKMNQNLDLKLGNKKIE